MKSEDKNRKRNRNGKVYIIIILYSLISWIISWLITSIITTTVFNDSNNWILHYLIFEISMFFFAFIMVIIEYKVFNFKEKTTLNRISKLILIIIIIFLFLIFLFLKGRLETIICNIPNYLNYIKKDYVYITKFFSNLGNIIKSVLAIISPTVFFQLIELFFAKFKSKLVPCISSEYIDFSENGKLLIDFNKVTRFSLFVKNCSKHDNSVTFIGIFTESKIKELKKQINLWKHKQFITKLSDDLYIYNPHNLESEKVSSYSEGKMKTIKYKDLNFGNMKNSPTLYAVYIDIYGKLHYVEFVVRKENNR